MSHVTNEYILDNSEMGKFQVKITRNEREFALPFSIIEANSAKIFEGFAKGQINAEALMPFEWQRSVLTRNNARDRSIKINSNGGHVKIKRSRNFA